MENWASGLYLSTECSDVELHISSGDQREVVFPGHELILRSASKVFKALLDRSNTPRGQKKVLEIQLQGDTSDALSFLRYLYTRNLSVKETTSYVSILHAAMFYEVTDLVRICEERLMHGLTPYSVCRICVLLENYAIVRVLDYCRALMLKFAFLVFSVDFHVCLSEKSMKFLLESNELNVLDEKQVMCALWEWGKTKCSLENTFSPESIKNKIAGLLSSIRWPLITAIDEEAPWSDLSPSSKIETPIERLNSSDDISLFRFANVLKFPSFFLGIVEENEPINADNPLITFKVERTILLVGIVLRIQSPYENREFLKYSEYLVNDETHDLISSKETETHKTYDSVSDKNLYSNKIRLEFQRPIVLEKSRTHRISVQFNANNWGNRRFMPTVKVFNTKQDQLRPDNVPRDLSVPFCVFGPVTALERIFYFVGPRFEPRLDSGQD